MQSRKSFPLAPVLLSLMLLGVSIWLCFLIYENHRQMTALANARNSEYASLLEREEELRGLLRLPPCEAKEKFEAEKQKQQPANPS